MLRASPVAAMVGIIKPIRCLPPKDTLSRVPERLEIWLENALFPRSRICDKMEETD